MTDEAPDRPIAEVDAPIKHPDRLVAFLHVLEQDGIDVQSYVNAATEINLNEVPKVPELVAGEPVPADHADGHRVHTWAFALTGSSAKARSAFAQLSDGETKGFINVGPDQIGDAVAKVSDEIARATAEAEKG